MFSRCIIVRCLFLFRILEVNFIFNLFIPVALASAFAFNNLGCLVTILARHHRCSVWHLIYNRCVVLQIRSILVRWLLCNWSLLKLTILVTRASVTLVALHYLPLTLCRLVPRLLLLLLFVVILYVLH